MSAPRMRRYILPLMLGACGSSAPPRSTTSPPPPPPVAAKGIPPVDESTLTIALAQRLTFEGGIVAHFDDLVIEDIAADPTDTYPVGSGITLTLVLEIEGHREPQRHGLSLLSAGYDSVHQAWHDRYRFAVLAVDDSHRAPLVRFTADRVTDRVRTGAPVVVRIERGGVLALDGARMKFLGHGSKHIGPGEESPLMVTVEYAVPRKTPEHSEHNAGTRGRPQRWQWRDYRFTILDHAYDAWMRLSIERLELEPLGVL